MTEFLISAGPLCSWSADRRVGTVSGDSILVSSPLSGDSTDWNGVSAEPPHAVKPYRLLRLAWNNSPMIAVQGGNAPGLAVSNDGGDAWASIALPATLGTVKDMIWLQDGDARLHDNRYMLLLLIRPPAAGPLVLRSFWVGRPNTPIAPSDAWTGSLAGNVLDASMSRVPIDQLSNGTSDPRQEGAVLWQQQDDGHVSMRTIIVASVLLNRTYVNTNVSGAQFVAGAAVQRGGNNGPVGSLSAGLAFALDDNTVLGAAGIVASTATYATVAQINAPAAQVRDLNAVALTSDAPLVCVTAGSVYRFVVNAAGNEPFTEFALPRTGDWVDVMGWSDGNYAVVESTGRMFWMNDVTAWEELKNTTDDPIDPPSDGDDDESKLGAGAIAGIVIACLAVLALGLGLGLGLKRRREAEKKAKKVH